jgi:hypothetical protein
MTTFDEREQAYEAKLAHDEELKFKADVRRNKWLGLWAAEKLGKEGKAAEDYASGLVALQLEGKGEEAVFRRIRADFDSAGVAQSDSEIRREIDELLAKAMKEVIAGVAERN